mmetsp:Transcript_11568/g.25364  ORF Transcript_11568/g.25364 Transcript_11568/m.25364 type:complete len:707 (+) Transcript_11568:62-2182(+)
MAFKSVDNDNSREKAAISLVGQKQSDDEVADTARVAVAESPPQPDQNQAAAADNDNGTETATKLDASLHSHCVTTIPHGDQQHEQKLCNGKCGLAKTKEEYTVSQWKEAMTKPRFCLVCSGPMPTLTSLTKKGTKRPAEEAAETPDQNQSAATANGTETATKIDAFLRSRCVGAQFGRVPLPDRPQYPERKQCNGICGLSKTKDEYSQNQWTRALSKGRFCHMCSQLLPPPPSKKKQKIYEASSFKFGEVEINDDDDIIARKPAAVASRKKIVDHELPPDLPRNKNGETPVGRIRSCMCRNPSVCRELLWRWARLREPKYVNYLNLPHSIKPDTPVGKHITAYREAVLRHLGYSSDEAQVTRTVKFTSKKGGKERTSMVKGERISIVHFHPDVIPYIIQGTDIGGNKLNKWRIPINLGKKLGLSDEDKCPAPGTRDEPTFFAVPTYSLEEATADVQKAEMQYKLNFKEHQALNEKMLSEMATDPLKYVLEIHDLKRQNVDLMEMNEELKERLKKEGSTQSAREKKTLRMQKALEKVARRLDKWESTKKIGRAPNCNANDIYKEATGKDLSEEGFFGVEPSGNQKYSTGSGGKRWSDPRMDQAVEARWEDPTLTSEEALRIGGYEFPPLDEKGVLQKDIMDSDNVCITQRKNNLLRRLRMKKKQMARKSGGEPEVEEEVDEMEEEAEENEMTEDADDLDMATVEDLV